MSAQTLVEHEVAHHFDDAEQEFESVKLGMWLFIASEIMMFGGLFVMALIVLNRWPESFIEGSRHLKWQFGTLNTFFLLTSGFTMALAAWQAQRRNQSGVRLGLIGSLVFAGCFLVVKAFEYSDKIHHGILPGGAWKAGGFEQDHTHLFYSLYYAMTGLHSVHVLVGMGLMVWCLMVAGKIRFTRSYFTPIEIVGIYWALVDLVWIFLFPLLYLLG